MIRIWKFQEAPQHLKNLHPQGTDTTWVMEVPVESREDAEIVLRASSNLLVNVSRYSVADGGWVTFGWTAPDLATGPDD